MTSPRTGRGPAATGRRRDAGYSLVEVMVVIAVTIVGFLALTSLQASILKANENSWNITSAVALARHVQETIRMEGLQWYNDSFDGIGGVAQERFRYLKHVGVPAAGTGSDWLDAEFYAAGTDFQLVNQLGNQGAYDAGALQEVRNDRGRRYCVRYRLTWIVPNYLIRTDVRVLWVRHEGRAGLYDACPMTGADTMENHPEDVFSISIPATVMRNVFVAP